MENPQPPSMGIASGYGWSNNGPILTSHRIMLANTWQCCAFRLGKFPNEKPAPPHGNGYGSNVGKALSQRITLTNNWESFAFR